MPSDETPRSRIRSVRVDGYPGLGGEVGLALRPRTTVLVGLNAAGKSITLTAIVRGMSQTLRQVSRWVGPTEFEIELELEDSGSVLTYTYLIDTHDDEFVLEEEDAREIYGARFVWTERCVLVEPDGSSRMLWRLADATLLVEDDRVVQLPEGVGALALPHAASVLPSQAMALRDCFRRVAFVPAGVPTGDPAGHPIEVAMPREIFIRRRGKTRHWAALGRADRSAQLAQRLALLFETDRSTFDEFSALMRKVGVIRRTSVREFGRLPDTKSPDDSTLGEVQFDGVNLGLASDGTLRVAEILLAVVTGASLLCIEEPETAVHPGLVQRLLAILQSYSHDSQLLMSTHSPYVVNWCEPADLRLVDRHRNRTRIREFSADEVNGVQDYLLEEKMLDEFVFFNKHRR